MGLTNVFMALLDARKDASKRPSSCAFSCFAKESRKMTSGWQGASCFWGIRPGNGFTTGDLIIKKIGRGANPVTTPKLVTTIYQMGWRVSAGPLTTWELRGALSVKPMVDSVRRPHLGSHSWSASLSSASLLSASRLSGLGLGYSEASISGMAT